ncbi:hypothetical protein ANN_17255 [Periplaneta americana]|uniref:BESS domain-containing protein n=1 Tax=Periplaneta americana TaxID=6978 RepID=A0ABQ8STR1_PERAM|nr:hypothetical protein ANN_17255 [Periplaneta americana]
MPSTWPGIEPATLDIEGQRYTNSPTRRRKFEAGRVVEGSWVLGLTDHETKEVRLEICPNNKRDKDTLLRRIRKHVADQTSIMTNCWKGYEGLDVPETVKKKWDNLRDRFVRALRDSTAIPPSGSGAPQKKNNFSLYNSMLWLAPYIRKRKMTSTVSSLDVTPSTSVEATSEAIHLSDDASTSTESPAPMQESSLGGSFQEEFRPKRANLHDTLSKVVNSFTSFVATREYSGPSDLNFMKSVLEDMKMIPHKDKFKFKKEVLDLLEKYIP